MNKSIIEQFSVRNYSSQYKSRIGSCPLCHRVNVLHVSETSGGVWIYCKSCKRGEEVSRFSGASLKPTVSGKCLSLFSAVKGALLPGRYLSAIGLIQTRSCENPWEMDPLDFQFSLRGEDFLDLLDAYGIPSRGVRRLGDRGYCFLPIQHRLGKIVGFRIVEAETGIWRDFYPGRKTIPGGYDCLWISLKEGKNLKRVQMSNLAEGLSLRKHLENLGTQHGLYVPVHNDLLSSDH